MVPQMLAAVNLAATALHDGVGALTAGFEGTTFVHVDSLCFLYFPYRKVSVLYNK
jgi:hypothetical protein